MHTIKLSMRNGAGYPCRPLFFPVSPARRNSIRKATPPPESFGGYATSNDVEASSLVAHFSFENNLIDSVSNSAATNNGTAFTPGIKGQGLQIGLNNYAVFNPTSGIASCQSITPRLLGKYPAGYPRHSTLRELCRQ